jgi:beta-lactamase class A
MSNNGLHRGGAEARRNLDVKTRHTASLLMILLLATFTHAQQPPAVTQRPSPEAAAREKVAIVPVTKHNTGLESRLKAVIGSSAGVWGVSVRHVELGESAGVNETQKFEMASVFKVGVLATLYRQAEQGKVGLDQRFTFEHPERYFGSGILATLKPGLQPTIYDLAVLMITISDNAATDTLCDVVGIANVNARLGELGVDGQRIKYCTRGLILDAAGLGAPEYQSLTRENMGAALGKLTPDERRANQQRYINECANCSTPQAMTTLLAKILAGEAANQDNTQQMLRILGQQHFNERLPKWIPGRVLHKTGSLGSPYWVDNDCGIVELPGGQHVIVSVFGHGTNWDADQAARKYGAAQADDTLAAIGKVVWDYYAGRQQSVSNQQ